MTDTTTSQGTQICVPCDVVVLSACDNIAADNPDEYGEILEENSAISYESG